MARNNDTRAEVKQITDRLAEGIKEVFQSGQYTNYLKTMSRFHSYSTRNTVLIHIQKPDATLVAGFRTWQTKFGRSVNKGEKGIRILAPTPFTVKKNEQVIDPQTQRPVLDAEGIPVTEEVEIHIPRFKAISVFDASQTSGKPLPTLAADIFGKVKNYDILMDALRAVSPLPIEIVPLPDNKDGDCTYGVGIRLRQGMSEVQTVCSAVHEITHAKLHDAALQADDEESDNKPKSTQTKEIEAESVAYAVCQYFGIETSPNSFGYLAAWSSGMELNELSASLDTIRRTSTELIDALEKQYRALAKERGIDLEEDADTAGPVEAEPGIAATAKRALDALAPGAMVYLDKAAKPVELTAVRSGEMVFTVPEFGVALTRSHAEVLQALIHHIDNRPLLDAVEAEEPDQLPEQQPEAEPTEPAAVTQPTPPPASQTEETAEPLPDVTIGIAALDEYGYATPGMLPLNAGRAFALFDEGQVVYLLHPDNTEQMVFERGEIEAHPGIFGIEAEEWRQTAEYSQLASGNGTATREADFLHGDGDAYAIYQLKSRDDLHFHRWQHYDEMQRDGMAIERANYDLVYTAPLPEGKTLDDIVMDFSFNRPADFRGNSLSTSDVVVLKQDGAVTSFYDDGGPFVPLPAFLGCEQPLEQNSQNGNTLDEYDGQSVVDFDDAVKRGETVSLFELSKAIKHERAEQDGKKPSILAQLQEHKGADNHTSAKAAPSHDKGQEV